MLMQDVRILRELLRGQAGNGTHAERLQRYYQPQAGHYDGFRERLLHGRRDLVELLSPPPGSTVVELGGGTGRNLEFFGPRMCSLGRVEIVDLCPALLEVARRRCARWPDVACVVEADAATYRPARPADCVIMSYALTMMPDWRATLTNALSMLRPGGLIGLVDFYISAAAPALGRARHGAVARAFWPRWFAHDGVHLSAEHLPELIRLTDPVCCHERSSSVPYMPGLRVPYYLFVGRKRRS
ncbi:MAG: class I SAM-dependent methyltransferase [Proteobacteria bacterium]|nr:class I SAM-dependent methyltransferase [Pseudomonadota bacterium]